MMFVAMDLMAMCSKTDRRAEGPIAVVAHVQPRGIIILHNTVSGYWLAFMWRKGALGFAQHPKSLLTLGRCQHESIVPYLSANRSLYQPLPSLRVRHSKVERSLEAGFR
jgi:hypothetical protein